MTPRIDSDGSARESRLARGVSEGSSMAVYTQIRFLPAGDRAVTVEIADEINPEVNAKIRALGAALDRECITGVVDVVPTYRSLLVYYDPALLRPSELESRILNLTEIDVALASPRVLQIPTQYGGDHGPDLEFVARHTGLSPHEVATIHAGTDYLVYMMGFNTGFPYLGGMSPRIAAPRLETPRLRVPAGSVALAQQQTGIYPVESPGGWRIIGRSPLRLFDPQRDPPVAIEAGDYMRFVQIDGKEYRQIEEHVRAGTYRTLVIEGTS